MENLETEQTNLFEQSLQNNVSLQNENQNENTDGISDVVSFEDLGLDEYTLKAGFRNPMVYRCRHNGNVEGRFFLTTDTVILKVPDIDTYGLEDFIKYQNSVS